MNGVEGWTLSRRSVYILSLSWLIFISLFFFPNWHPLALLSNQLPVMPEDILAAVVRLFSDGLPALAMLAVGVLAALGAGSLVLSPFRVSIDNGQRATLSIALGLGVLSYLAFFIGILDGYNQTGAAIAKSCVAVFSILGVRVAVKSTKEVRPKTPSGWQKVLFLSLFIIVSVFLFAKALRPAVFYDAVTYHLGVPNYYLQEGGIKYIPYDSFSNFPFMAEMLYTLGMFLHGLKLAQFSSVLVFLLCVFAVHDFSRSFIKGLNPALPAVLFLLTPAFIENSVLYTCDLHLTYYTLMVIYCYFLWEKYEEPGFILLMGIFTGMCLGTKYIALVSITLPASAAVFYMALKKRDQGAAAFIRTLALFAVPALVVYLPWLLKNFLNTGNPFYPAFFNLLGGKDLTAAQYGVDTTYHPDKWHILKGLWEHPWKLFMTRPGYITRTYRAAAYLGPVIVIFSPLLFFLKGVSPVVKKLCILAVALFILWDVSIPLTRYLYPGLAVLLILSAYAATKLMEKAPAYFKALIGAGAALYLVFNLSLGFFLVDQWTASYGLERRRETDEEYLMRRSEPSGNIVLYSYPAYRFINGNSDPDARVLVIGDAQHLYIKRRHLYTYLSASTPYEIFREKAGNTRDIYETLKSQGITYIVYNPAEMVRLQRSGYISYPEKDNPLIMDFLKSGYAGLAASFEFPGRPVYVFKLR